MGVHAGEDRAAGRPLIRAARARPDLAPYLYIAPFFLLFIVFGLFPLLFNGWIALHDWNPIGGGRFLGLGNFSRLMADPRFGNALSNTISILALAAIPQTLLALGFAHVLNERLLKAKTFFRMALLVPNVTSTIAVGVVFSSIFGRDFGIANFFVTALGLERIDWQAGDLTSHVAIATMVAWRWTGYTTLIFLAAMQAVPRDLHDVATVDGASSLRRLVHITIPQIRPTILFVVILTTIGGLQTFAEPLIFGGVSGGSDRQFQTVVQFLYEQGFINFRFGYAAAISWMLFAVILVFSLLNWALTSRAVKS